MRFLSPSVFIIVSFLCLFACSANNASRFCFYKLSAILPQLTKCQVCLVWFLMELEKH